MEAIAFVLWMIGWPLFYNIGIYYEAKIKEITGETHTKSDGAAAFISILIWIWVGVMLYGKI